MLEHWLAVAAICVGIIVAAVGGLGFVSVQLGARIADDSEPEPDVAVVEGEIADCRDARELRAAILDLSPRV